MVHGVWLLTRPALVREVWRRRVRQRVKRRRGERACILVSPLCRPGRVSLEL